MDALPGQGPVAAAWNQPIQTDWDEAQRQLRERLTARDNNTLDVVRKGRQLTFNEWADFFLENYSKPPIRAREDSRSERERAEDARPVFGT